MKYKHTILPRFDDYELSFRHEPNIGLDKIALSMASSVKAEAAEFPDFYKDYELFDKVGENGCE